MICAVTHTATGAGLASVTFPLTGKIRGAYCTATQTTPAFASLNGQTVPTSGVSGLDRALVCVFAGTNLFMDTLNFPIKQNQVLFIDVKVAATFVFYVEV